MTIEGRVQDPETGPKTLAWEVSGDGGSSGEVLVDSDGSFRLELATGTLSGERQLVFTGEHSTGETARTSVRLRDGRLPPEVRIAQPSGGGAFGSQLVLSGSVVDPYAGDSTMGGIASVSWEMTPLDASARGKVVSGQLALDAGGGFQALIPTRGLSGQQMVSVVAVGVSGNRGRSSVRVAQGGSDIPSFVASAGDASVTSRWDDAAAGVRHDLLYVEDAQIGDGSRAHIIEDVRSPFEVRGLVNGSRYVFRLRSSRAGEPEGQSSDLEAVPLSPGTLKPKIAGEYGGVRLAWTPAPGVKTYEVWRSARAEGEWELAAANLTAATWLDAGAAAGLTYWYRVRPGIAGAIASEAVPGAALKFASRALEPAGSLALAGGRAVAVAGEYAWVCCGPGGVRVVDLSSPDAPKGIASLSLPDARAVAVSGTLACVVDGERGLVTIDASEPWAPREVGARYLPDPRAVALRSDIAYVACAAGGVRLIDVSDPRTPVRLGTLESPDARTVLVRRDLLLVGDAGSGFAVFDIASPREPRAIASLPIAGARWVHESSGKAVVIGTDGLAIVDLGDPAHPAVLGTVAGPASCAVLTVDGYALVAGGPGLMVLDAMGPTRRPIDTVPASGVTGITLAGDLACMLEAGSLRLLHVRVLGRPTLVGEAAVDGSAARITMNGGRAFVAARSSGLLVFDVSEEASRRTFRPAGVFSARFAEDVAVAGSLAFIADGAAGLRIVAVEPAGGGTGEYRARELSLFQPGGVVHSVTVDGSIACAAAGSGGALVLDVSDPAVPRKLASIVSPDARDVALEGSMLLVADAVAGLRFFDLSVPGRPVENRPALRPAFRLSAGKGWALAVGADGVYLVEWGDSTAPAITSFYPTLWAEDTCRDGDRVLVAEGHRGLTVVDLSDPARPRVVSTRRDLYAATVDAAEGCVLVAGAGSLKALQVLVPPWLER